LAFIHASLFSVIGKLAKAALEGNGFTLEKKARL
jgi:hypothetical protein